MIEQNLTRICIGNSFKQGYITAIISSKEIIIDNNLTVSFDDLQPIEFTPEILKEYGYSDDNTIHNNAKIFILKEQIQIKTNIYESGIYISDSKNNIVSNRIKYVHEFQNIESFLIETLSPFD
ncbi:hypothetical protein [Chryseobacterium sp. CFS15]|uniref:hypothetical protein n=1 Tax=Chryseobacterium sp. CFS15 TaxID=2986946 RepID=UPI0028081EA8|nr:hypothetical protein [Chryseobacterium sp. CFS15]MDQ8142114.1 hypothetical protein [Chryseobacterium sp. CFS15]